MGISLPRLAEALDTRPSGPWARTVRLAHEAAVTIGVLVLVLLTQPDIADAADGALDGVFWTLAALFALEYLLRLAIAPWAHWAHRDEPWRARAHWARTFTGMVDLAGALPILALAVANPDTARLFGALWLVKLVPYAPGLDLVGRVLRNARGTLFGLFLGFLMVLVIAATLGYVFERAAQPATFGTIPRALWWAVTTLTTVGYGDEIPATTLGRMLAGAVMLCGIGVCALWTAILVAGFSYEMRRSEFLRTWDLVARVPYFKGLGAGTIAEVAQLLRPSDFAAGTAIMRRGEPGDCMYFIVSGEISIELRPKPVVLGPGDFFGEMALVTGDPRSATAVTRTHCELLHLDLADFRRLEARHPEVAMLIAAEARRRKQESAGVRELSSP
jgi:voltage-gated potassium channel